MADALGGLRCRSGIMKTVTVATIARIRRNTRPIGTLKPLRQSGDSSERGPPPLFLGTGSGAASAPSESPKGREHFIVVPATGQQPGDLMRQCRYLSAGVLTLRLSDALLPQQSVNDAVRICQAGPWHRAGRRSPEHHASCGDEDSLRLTTRALLKGRTQGLHGSPSETSAGPRRIRRLPAPMPGPKRHQRRHVVHRALRARLPRQRYHPAHLLAAAAGRRRPTTDATTAHRRPAS